MARLLRALVLFQGSPQGLTSAELGERLGVTQRQAQRDIRALEEYAEVPFYRERNRWRVLPEYWLKPIALSLPEAMGLLLSARLMLRFADKADAFTASAYEKLAAVLPESVRQPVVDAAFALRTKASNEVYSRVMAALSNAWAGRRKVAIRYLSGANEERVVWPLFIEPAAMGHSSYLLAWDPAAAGPRVFKVERIRSARTLAETFEVPPGFSVHDHLARAWTIWGGPSPVDVELIFSKSVAARLRETTWHPSQSLQDLAGGRVRMRLQVGSWIELRHWVLGWGEACEVKAPLELRQSVIEAVRALRQTYDIDPPARKGMESEPRHSRRRVRSPRGGQVRPRTG